MSRKFLFAILVFLLAVPGCNLQTVTPTPSPVVITETVPPPAPTGTPLIPTSSPTVTDTPGGSPAAPGELTEALLKNGTYTTPFYNRTVTLVDGSYTEGSGASLFFVKMLDIVAFGDLNGDGKNDAAILLAENGGGSGVFESVVAVLNQDGSPRQVSQALLGDRVLVNSIDISSGVIHLEMVVQGPTDPMCCPSMPQKQNYWLINSRLWLMRLTSTIAGTEHQINIGLPGNWVTVPNPFTVSGSMTVRPFENTLAYHLYLTDGTLVNESSFTVTPFGDIGGTFSHEFNLGSAGITDWVIIQLVDVSAADGSTIALGSVIMKAR